MFELTSERKLLSVGLTKSVVVTSTVGEKIIPMAFVVLAYSERNLVSVLKVVQGRGQLELSDPSKRWAKALDSSWREACLVTLAQSLVNQIGTIPGLISETRTFR